MLRASLASSGLRQLSSTPLRHNARTLVSTVLLTKTWENEPVSELKKEAKSRGLSTKGNRTTLITRIQEHEQTLASPSTPRDAPAFARSASTTTQSSASPSPSNDVPPAVYAKQYLDVKIPDLSAPPPEPPIAIPFVPDFWESSRVKHEAAPTPTPTEPGLPKIVVVAGTSTHAAGGPTYNLAQADEFTSPPSSSSSSSSTSATSASESASGGGKKLTGLWADIAEDLGLPTTFRLPRVGSVAADAEKALADSLPDESTVGRQGSGASYERRLDKEEKRGVWVLLGLLGGSWLVGGIFSRSSAFGEHEHAEEAEAKAEH